MRYELASKAASQVKVVDRVPLQGVTDMDVRPEDLVAGPNEVVRGRAVPAPPMSPASGHRPGRLPRKGTPR